MGEAFTASNRGTAIVPALEYADASIRCAIAGKRLTGDDAALIPEYLAGMRACRIPRHLLYTRLREGCAPVGGGDDGMKLDLKAFALAGGLFWGLGVFVLTWWLLLTRSTRGRGSRYGELVGRIYPGYRVSPKGSVIGLIWGFIDGLAAAGIFGLLYNHFAKEK